MKPTCLSRAWIREQHLLRDELIRTRGAPDRDELASLISRALDGYGAYFRVRSDSARYDPLAAISPPSTTPLERAVQWVSGWRPNILIHILYTESGSRFEAQLADLLAGVRSGDLGDISPAQLKAIDELQRATMKDEMEIDEELGRIQESVPDPFLPSDSDLDLRVERIAGLMRKADELRMRTLRAVVGILHPVQAADLLVAVADFEIGLRKLGLELEQCPIRSGKSGLDLFSF